MSPHDVESGDAKLVVSGETLFKLVRLSLILVVPLALFVGIMGLFRLPRIPGGVPWRPPAERMSDAEAQEKLKRADELAAAGNLAESARVSQEVAEGPSSPAMAAAAVEQVKARAKSSATHASAQEAADILRVAVELRHTGRWPEPADALYKQGMALVRQERSTDPTGALEILEVVAPIAPQGGDLNELRRELLEKLVAAHPDDPEIVSRLAGVFEATGQEERALRLLEPIRERLGTTEGARILGLADARRGQANLALGLLRPYVRTRLELLGAADQAWQSATKRASQRAVDRLLADSLAFDSGSSNATKGKRMSKRLGDLFENDPESDRAWRRRASKYSVVPVAHELGTMLLTHAQSQADRNSRESLLDEAEKLFLDVAQVSGPADSDRDRLCLAEVCWRPAAAISTRCSTSSTRTGARRKNSADCCNDWSTLIWIKPTKLPGQNPSMPAAKKVGAVPRRPGQFDVPSRRSSGQGPAGETGHSPWPRPSWRARA
jgi:hypothetical protein